MANDPLNESNRPAVVINTGDSKLDLIEIPVSGGDVFTRLYSNNGGAQWTLPSELTSENLWQPRNWIGGGTFRSGPAAAVSGDGLHVHVFGRGMDNAIWHAYSSTGGRSWNWAWRAIPSGILSSAPAAAVSDDGQRLHVFARGMDDRMWHACSSNGGAQWDWAWRSIPSGTFSSAPAAAVSFDGMKVHVVGRGMDNRMWHAFSSTGAQPGQWDWAWRSIPSGTFSSAPAAAVANDGLKLHVFGRGMDNRMWHAFSSVGGRNSQWDWAWSPVGARAFGSGPAAVCSIDGQRVRVYGRDVEPVDDPNSFEIPPGIYSAFSINAGAPPWEANWRFISPQPGLEE